MVFLLTGPACIQAQDALWLSPGMGFAFCPRSALVHIPLSANFLRHDQWGFTLGMEFNGRPRWNQVANSLQSYAGSMVCFAYNFRPYNEVKMIARGGISKGDIYYLKEQLPSVVQSSGTTKVFDSERYNTWGIYLGFELMIPSPVKDYRAWSFECFANLMRRSYIGIGVKYNIGALYN